MPAVKSEYVSERHHGHGRVDRAAGIIRGVLVIKAGRSANNYVYEEDAIRKAVGLYSKSPVFLDHTKPGESTRSLNAKVGWLDNVRLDGAAIKADLHVIKSHPHAAMVFEAAERHPGHFGLSHEAKVTWQDSRRQRVRSIDQVRAVALTDRPATTSTLFESRQPPSKEQFFRNAFGHVAEAQLGMDRPTDDEPVESPAEPTEEAKLLAARVAEIATDFSISRKERDAKIKRLLDLLDGFADVLTTSATESRRRAFGNAVHEATRSDAVASVTYEQFKRGLTQPRPA